MLAATVHETFQALQESQVEQGQFYLKYSHDRNIVIFTKVFIKQSSLSICLQNNKIPLLLFLVLQSYS